jgi:hypothetical protein
VNIVFIAPLAARTRAIEVETRRAVEDGHRVLLVAEGGPRWLDRALDARVETAWLEALPLSAEESRLTGLAARRLPLGLLRRIGRGPLRAPARRVSRAWKRRVVDRLDTRMQRETGLMRESHRLKRIRAALSRVEPDWLVLHEPSAVELGIDFVPGLLEARPQMLTSYAYEPARKDGDER